MKDMKEIEHLILDDWEDRLSDFFYYNRKEDLILTKRVLKEYIKNNYKDIRSQMIYELDECLDYLVNEEPE